MTISLDLPEILYIIITAIIPDSEVWVQESSKTIHRGACPPRKDTREFIISQFYNSLTFFRLYTFTTL